ncbi:MAG TPA: cupredoxin domain-containing protein [Solirubrobacteraceae bacterium]
MRRLWPRAAAAGATVLTLAACGSSASTAGPSAAGATARAAGVVIRNYAFAPAVITVPGGATLTFINRDRTNHTATATGGGFDTGTIPPGATRTVTLKEPGRYTYFCQFHAFMRSTVVVR